MCRFCERKGEIVKKITSDKYGTTRKKYDGFFGEVVVGEISESHRPTMMLETNKARYHIAMPVEFLYCPHCGRKIKGEEK